MLDPQPLGAVSLPILSRDQVAQHVVDRRYRYASDETIAVGELLVSMHPDSIREAEEIEARLIVFDIFREDPVQQFERLTGRKLSPLDEEDEAW